MNKHSLKVPIDSLKFAECEDGKIVLRIKGVVGEYCISKDQAEAMHKDLELALYELQKHNDLNH